MRAIKTGDRVQVGDGGTTGRVTAVVQGAVMHVRYDRTDPFGNVSGDYLADVLRPLRKRPR